MNLASDITTKDSNWSWFSVLSPKSNTSQRTTKRNSLSTNDHEFEVVHEELNSKSYNAAYDDALLLENNFQINDQYVNLNEYGSAMPLEQVDDDEKAKLTVSKPDNQCMDNKQDEQDEEREEEDMDNKDKIEDDIKKTGDDRDDAVMISQTLTLKSRNQELEKERDALHAETLQLRMQTECLKQTNQHIIAVKTDFIFMFVLWI